MRASLQAQKWVTYQFHSFVVYPWSSQGSICSSCRREPRRDARVTYERQAELSCGAAQAAPKPLSPESLQKRQCWSLERPRATLTRHKRPWKCVKFLGNILKGLLVKEKVTSVIPAVFRVRPRAFLNNWHLPSHTSTGISSFPVPEGFLSPWCPRDSRVGQLFWPAALEGENCLFYA